MPTCSFCADDALGRIMLPADPPEQPNDITKYVCEACWTILRSGFSDRARFTILSQARRYSQKNRRVLDYEQDDEYLAYIFNGETQVGPKRLPGFMLELEIETDESYIRLLVKDTSLAVVQAEFWQRAADSPRPEEDDVAWLLYGIDLPRK